MATCRSRWTVLTQVSATLAVVLVAAIACSPRTPIDSARGEVMDLLAECARQFAYDPANPGVDDNHLAASERPWRECAYAAIEADLAPRSLAPTMYRNLIRADREMTDEIERGNMTRSVRRQRLEVLLDRIDIRERELEREQTYYVSHVSQIQSTQADVDRIARMQNQAAIAARVSAVRAGLR